MARYFPFWPITLLCSVKTDRTFGVVSVTLSNTTDTVAFKRVSVRIPGWSDDEIQTVELAPGTTRTVVFAPAFLPRLYQNHEITAATAQRNHQRLSPQ